MLDEIGTMEFEALAKVFREAMAKKDEIIENGRNLRMTVARLPPGRAMMEFGGDISGRVIALKMEHEEVLEKAQELEKTNADLELLNVGYQKRIDSWSSDERQMCDKIARLEDALDKIRFSTTVPTCVCCKANQIRAQEGLDS